MPWKYRLPFMVMLAGGTDPIFLIQPGEIEALLLFRDGGERCGDWWLKPVARGDVVVS